MGTGLFQSRPRDDGSESNETIAFKQPYEATGGRFVEVGKPLSLFPGAWLTGPVPRTHPERNWSGRTKIRSAEGLVEDTLPEDMSLVLDTDRGLVVVSGCGHAGVINTLEYARKTVRDTNVFAALGGFHLFPADAATLDWTAGKLRDMRVAQLLGAHCTDLRLSTSSVAGLDSTGAPASWAPSAGVRPGRRNSTGDHRSLIVSLVIPQHPGRGLEIPLGGCWLLWESFQGRRSDHDRPSQFVLDRRGEFPLRRGLRSQGVGEDRQRPHIVLTSRTITVRSSPGAMATR